MPLLSNCRSTKNNIFDLDRLGREERQTDHLHGNLTRTNECSNTVREGVTFPYFYAYFCAPFMHAALMHAALSPPPAAIRKNSYPLSTAQITATTSLHHLLDKIFCRLKYPANT